ncbi:MAG TPA: M56 family metallopeptidase [Candidatus Udaeobacter sp.]|nr:M56 family metallopeptidase [Candidatus Udaeobacter sp.]
MRSGILNKKTNFIFIGLSAISLVLLTGLGWAGIKFYQYFNFILNSVLGKIQTTCSCQAPISFTNHPYAITAIFIAALGLTITISLFINKTFRIYLQTKRFIKKYTKHGSLNSEKLNRIIAEINLNNKVLEIETEEPMVFCYGFINPRICISSAIIKSLSYAELKAVLRHEQHHLKSSEPIKLFIIKIINNILFFIPGIKNLTKQYAIFSELSADEAATDNFKNKIPLARALNKILDQKENMLIQQGLAVSFFSQIIEERVNKLTDNNYIPELKFGFIKLFSSLATLVVLIFSAKFLHPAYNQIFPTENYTANCPFAQEIKTDTTCANNNSQNTGWYKAGDN